MSLECITETDQIEPAECDLDESIKKEMDRRIEVYTKRVQKGVDLFSGNKLNLTDLCSTRGLGNYPIITALSMLPNKDLKLYRKEIRKYRKEYYAIPRTKVG